MDGTFTDPSLDDRLERLLGLLGYLGDPDYRTGIGPREAGPLRHSLDLAFERIGVVGALTPRAPLANQTHAAVDERRIPVVYVVTAADEDEADARHRAIWSQSVVPQILMATPAGFSLRNGFDYRQKGALHPWSELDGSGLPRELVPLTSLAIRSSSSWRNFTIPNRVDARIAADIRNLSVKVRKDHPGLGSRPGLVNALIGHFLYLNVLVDRGVLDQAWIDGLTDADGRRLCPDITLRDIDPTQRGSAWPVEQVWLLFDAIDGVLNGSIFPIGKNERELVTTEVSDLVRRVLRSDTLTEDGGQQFSFIDVDYAVLRSETISAIYECFFDLEGDGERRNHGAFYTPSFLVDYVVQEADRIRSLDRKARVLDPACGSGAFLVAGYRHILEADRADGATLSPMELGRVLSDSIRGVELKAQAANVARFSLYLTMLDYLPGRTLASLADELGDRQLFPDLSHNIIDQDAFELLPDAFAARATHVFGNPPWNRYAPASPAAAYAASLLKRLHDTVVDEQAQAEVFYWRAMLDLAAEDAVIAFVMPTKAFIAPGARHFPHAVATRTRLHGVANLTSFRRKLFQDAGEAATVVFASPGAPGPLAMGWRFSPQLSAQPLGADGRPWAIVIDRSQVERFHQAEMSAADYEWYRDLLLQPLDRRIVAALETNGSARSPLNVSAFLKASHMHVSTGETWKRTGLPEDLVLGTHGDNDFRLRLGLSDAEPLGLDEEVSTNYQIPDELFDSLSDRFRAMFGGPTLFMPRSQATPHVVGRAAFNASIQGIYFTGTQTPEPERREVLREFALYLRTGVGRYMVSLFGRSWIADQRRFETPDLKRLPFPYKDRNELLRMPVSDFFRNGKEDVEGFALFAGERLGMPPLFAQAVLEHRSLRERAQNGKRLPDCDTVMKDADFVRYADALRDELGHLLAHTPLSIRLLAPNVGGREVQVVLAPPGVDVAVVGTPDAMPDFGSQAAIELTEHVEYAVAHIFKPDVKTAWTTDRAYSDAIGVANRVMAA
ncbi:N-6 DNA methylase [Sphingomonas sp. CLY1604]|uniref:N-6 DNA methylase n=1 Tax=Sphingomonas sp. CLY1604 TaxID=3457786 RepID=UPI003FD7BE89